jgi:6-pyruvoyltetrahydropterin/6-carboxytetrahydropterin synthase
VAVSSVPNPRFIWRSTCRLGVSLVYTVAVKRDFVAQHFLVGGDWGRENQLHSHHYQVEVQLHGASLDQHGYLVDIVDVEKRLDDLVCYYRDRTLNDLPEFAGLNPSIEHFSRILCAAFAGGLRAENISSVTVKLWENEIAWASYEVER